jgi:ribokinase
MIDVLVIGSINADQVVRTNRIPNIGETIIGASFDVVPGGKGANQAVAASRLGAKTDFIGCVGNDSNGEYLIKNFIDNKVSVDSINKTNTSTGVACITVCNGENSIIVVPGANFLVDKSIIDKNIDKIKNSKIVLLQLEIPLETVRYIVNICYENNVKVILNPAPYVELDKEIIDKVTYLTPNEHEAELMFNSNKYDEIVSMYPNKLIITLGEMGAMFHDGEKVVLVPAIKVDVVDTTGAGDTFNGALAVGIINGYSLEQCIRYANKAASLKIKKLGAQTGMPTKEEMED